MRIINLLVIFLILNSLSFSQVTIKYEPGPGIKAEVTDARPDETTLRYHFTSFGLKEITVNGETYHKISLEQGYPQMEVGEPEVLLTANSLIIPDNGQMIVEILGAEYQDFPNINLIPSRGVLYRNINPSDVPYQKGVVYNTDKFYPGQLAWLRDPYIIRDFRGQAVVVQPFQYNPVTKVLRVYYDITVKVSKAGPGGLNCFNRTSAPMQLADEFFHIYQRHFLNFGLLGINYTPVGEAGKMLVISYGAFMPEMLDFVRWKNQKGIPTEMVDVSTAGTTSAAIKTYVTNYYNTNGLTYLLLVGDAAQIPTNTLSSGHSDNAYAYILGNDSYPEFFVGRFSAETNGHVETQVIRTLSYEISPDTTGGWLEKSIGIASLEGPGHFNELDYQHVRLMQTDLLAFTYNGNLEYFEGNQGGNDAPGNPSAASVETAVNDGAGIILYTGHGSTTSWGTSGFSNTNVNSLINTTKWPFIWAVACVNGNFVNNTCFGEAWLRAAKNDQPTGAIAILASTINQSWDPPMDGQDEMVDILVESYQNNIKRTFGGLSMNGCMKMNDINGSAGASMTDTWTVFGDPSINVFTKTPLPINATHPPIALLGASQFSVFTPVNGARATLSKNGQILGSGIVSGSYVTINYTSPLTPDTMLLVITAFNHIPYITEIPVLASNAPFLVYKSHIVNDQNSNNNQRAEFGEIISLDLSLENIGALDAGNVNVILRSLDTHVNVIDSVAVFGTIANGTTQQILNAFSIELSDSVPDGHLASMQLMITDSASNQWAVGFNLLCHAPNLVIDTLFINDLTGGNGNGKLEPGEVVIVNAVVRNSGGAEAKQYSCTISSSIPEAKLFGNLNHVFGNLPLNTPTNLHFYARLDTGIAFGTHFRFDVDFVTGGYKANAFIGDLVLGGHEDFETANFQKFNWQHSGNNTWTISTYQPKDGLYCARSGIIGNNAFSVLSIDWYSAISDTISFWYKVSCENGSLTGQKWDNLEFFIDGVSQGWWDGNKPWMKAAFPVPAGQHTFTWRYQKDGYAAAGSDAAWIDLITFPAAGGTIEPKPFMFMDWSHFSDTKGNNNGIINAGETIDISYKISNLGYASGTNITGQLSVNDPLVSLTNPISALGNFQPVSSLFTGEIMEVKISNSATAGQMFTFNFTLTDDKARIWEYPFTMIVDGVTAVDKVTREPSLLIYPNPFRNILNLRIPGQDLQGGAKIYIFAADGRLILDEQFNFSSGNDEIITLKTQEIPPGAMMLKVVLKDKVLTQKILKR